jgi:hypothetical protein
MRLEEQPCPVIRAFVRSAGFRPHLFPQKAIRAKARTTNQTTVNNMSFSPHGVGLYTTAPRASGEQFLLKLRAGGTLLLVIYTVKHCHPAPPGSYRIGAEFSGFLRTGELESASDLFRVLVSFDEAANSAAGA